jgi:hypothetical protein
MVTSKEQLIARATLMEAIGCCNSWEPTACLIGNVTAEELGDMLRELRDRRAAETPAVNLVVAFERWAKSEHLPIGRVRTGNMYASEHTQWLWAAWQAARSALKAPDQPSRSVQRRVAAMRGEPAPEFGPSENGKGEP